MVLLIVIMPISGEHYDRNAIIFDSIDQPMFLGYSSGPLSQSGT